MIPMVFDEVRVTAVADTPVLLLREQDGVRYLAVWISAVGANAILSALEGVDEDHPGTHDLMVDTLSVLDAVLEQVRIVGVDDGVFGAELIVNGSTLACRVSDGVALALRCGAPILASEAVLDAAGTPAATDGADPDLIGGADEQVEQFRQFLDSITPDDFSHGGPQP